MSHPLRTSLGVAALAICAVAPATPAAAASARQDHVERAVVRQVNAVRAQHGLRALRTSRGLARAADAKAHELAQRNVLDHASPDGTSMLNRVRRYVDAHAYGETLATAPRVGGEAAIIVRAWMSSPAHRAALLSPRFRRVGVGRRAASGHRSFVAVDLASAR